MQFSVVEVAVGASIALTLAIVAVPAFVSNLAASKQAEAVRGTEQIAVAALSLLSDRADLPLSPAPRTPAEVPRGQAVTDPPELWREGAWRALGFSPPQPHHYAYTFRVSAPGEPVRFSAMAEGDLDGDGTLSLFEIECQVAPQGNLTLSPLRVWSPNE